MSAPVSLDPAALDELADAVAARVLAQLDSRAPARLVDAQGLADLLGVDRGFVYEHADELGAIRLGDGPRAPLRFDPDEAMSALRARRSPAAAPVPARRPPRPRRGRANVELIRFEERP